MPRFSPRSLLVSAVSLVSSYLPANLGLTSVLGRYACVGKQLGLMEVRYVTCLVLHRFTAELAGNKSASTSTFLAGLKDRFTLAVPDLEMVFTTRTS